MPNTLGGLAVPAVSEREQLPKVVVHPVVAWARRNRSRIRNWVIGLALAAVYIWYFQGFFLGGLPLRAGTYDSLDGALEQVTLQDGAIVGSFQVDAGGRDVTYSVHSDAATVFKLRGKAVTASDFARFSEQEGYVTGDIVVGEDGLLVSVDQQDL